MKPWGRLWVLTIIASITATGCGAAVANNSGSTANPSTTGDPSNNSMGNAMASTGNSMSGSGVSDSSMVHKTTTTSVGSPLKTSDILVGAAASMAMGPGNGELLMDSIGKGRVTTIPLASGANAFRIAISGNRAYVPTLQGQTYIVNLQSKMVMGHFTTPKGARIANIADQGKLLLITGKQTVTAYSLPSHTVKWQVNVGGNALSIVNNKAYLSSNTSSKTIVLNLLSGKKTGTVSVGHIEDSIYDKQAHTLWLANWTTGDMTIVNTQNNRIITTVHETEGGGFNMKNMMKSSGGFMQLATGSNGKYVYAASFSGNIMVYNARTNKFTKDIAIGSNAKLSGLAIDPSNKYIYTTVENKKETVAVSLKTDKVVSTMQGVLSNRWRVIHGS